MNKETPFAGENLESSHRIEKHRSILQRKVNSNHSLAARKQLVVITPCDDDRDAFLAAARHGLIHPDGH